VVTTDPDAPAPTGGAMQARPGAVRTRVAVTDRWVIGGEVVVAAVVVLWGLGAKSFWLDEAFTWSSVHRSWPAFVHHVTTSEAGGAGYLALMWLWSRVSDVEWFLRLPSALCALPLVPVVALTGRRLFGRRVALVAGLLIAINVNVVVFGQETRTYLLTMLLGAISVYGFVGEITAPSRRTFWTWIVPGGLLVYTQPAGIGVLVAQAVSLLFVPADHLRRERDRLTVGGAVIAAMSAPMLVLLAVTRGDRTHFLEGGRSVSEIVHAVASIAATGARALVVVLLALALYALTGAWREWRRGGRTVRAWSHALLWCWLVVPTVVTILASFVEHSFQSRYLVQVTPALVLLVAVALCALRPLWLGTAALAVVVALSGFALAGYYNRPKDDWRDATAWLVSHARPGDGIVFLGDEARIPFEYYLHREGGDAHGLVPLYPDQPWTRFRTGDETQRFPTASEVRVWARGDRRIWTVTARGGSWPAGQDDAAARRSVADLRVHMRPVQHHVFRPDVDVVLYAPATATTRAVGST
jgi:mannosyltransferase